ncbi:hypothetical protein FYK55_13965 [Roseiconus nitratireducens]|uniref:DUF883 domain-containing protein n=1 Tax=Roseiconus nitratireducens TaxID=2605748 RepID=A0A5M6D7K5_9BACT|nr:hypothetical protein [Roseiconus nitratireducens]KAA5542636.1 hypothetical protein FYK55_13965 [Roseiconus nitratireducens]
MENETAASHEHAKLSEQAREQAQHFAHSAVEVGQEAAQHYVKEPAKDLFGLAKEYAKDNPDVAACWAFGLGFLLGWKLKP